MMMNVERLFLLFANSIFDDDREGGGYMDGNTDDNDHAFSPLCRQGRLEADPLSSMMMIVATVEMITMLYLGVHWEG